MERRSSGKRRGGLDALREFLRKPAVRNERTLAEARKPLKEAEAIDVEILGRRIENEHRQLAHVAKQFRLVVAAQRCSETGGVDGFVAVLKDLSGA